MIDQEMIALTEGAIGALKEAADLDETFDIREQFGLKFREVLGRALATVTPEAKIAFFDRTAQAQIKSLSETILEAEKGEFRDRDSADTARIWEEFCQVLFGPDVFDATNALSEIFND